jgi:hypothetical protein
MTSMAKMNRVMQKLQIQKDRIMKKVQKWTQQAEKIKIKRKRKSLCVGRTQTKCMKRSICTLTNAGKKKSYCRAKKNRRITKKRRTKRSQGFMNRVTN